ncbi:hypothetical protein [Candidatus Clostridium radicumherbarum]|uniref:Uncharacterized protein n=1 Tax=Candidatus Clostridium radicumherbarum TaxID=3381662 RepID=A0ABW8TNL8_9CLOT
MELEVADKLNILGAELSFIGEGLAVLAARMAAEQKLEQNVERKKQLDEEATELNKISNWIILLGDSTSLYAAELEAQENIIEISNDELKLEATNLNLISGWLNVFGDAFAVKAQALEESSENDTTVP